MAGRRDWVKGAGRSEETNRTLPGVWTSSPFRQCSVRACVSVFSSQAPDDGSGEAAYDIPVDRYTYTPRVSTCINGYNIRWDIAYDQLIQHLSEYRDAHYAVHLVRYDWNNGEWILFFFLKFHQASEVIQVFILKNEKEIKEKLFSIIIAIFDR